MEYERGEGREGRGQALQQEKKKRKKKRRRNTTGPRRRRGEGGDEEIARWGRGKPFPSFKATILPWTRILTLRHPARTTPAPVSPRVGRFFRGGTERGRAKPTRSRRAGKCFSAPDSAHLLLLCWGLVEVDTRALLHWGREGGRHQPWSVQQSRQSLRGRGTEADIGPKSTGRMERYSWWIRWVFWQEGGGLFLVWWARLVYWPGRSLMFRAFCRIGIIRAYSYLDYSDKIIDEINFYF